MYTGYITNQDNVEVARDYEAAILVWYKRLKSMYLPQSGFCLYPPEEGGARNPDTYCAPLGVKHLLTLPLGRDSLEMRPCNDASASSSAQPGRKGVSGHGNSGTSPYGVKQKALQELLEDIRAMVKDAVAYYQIDYPPKKIDDCHAAYQVLAN